MKEYIKPEDFDILFNDPFENFSKSSKQNKEYKESKKAIQQAEVMYADVTNWVESEILCRELKTKKPIIQYVIENYGHEDDKMDKLKGLFNKHGITEQFFTEEVQSIFPAGFWRRWGKLPWGF